MRNIHPDYICINCGHVNPYDRHKCGYTAVNGDPWTSARSGRIGLAKDGTKCKYFVMNKNFK